MAGRARRNKPAQEAVEDEAPVDLAPRKTVRGGKKTAAVAEIDAPAEAPAPAPKGKAKRGAPAAVAEADGSASSPAKKVKLAKVASVGVPRGATPRAAALASAFKIISWNVNGLRAIIKSSKDEFVKLVQETKLQDGQGEAFNKLLPGYKAYWAYSTVTKGYSGSAAFIREGHNATVTFGTEDPDHIGEGRAITIEMPKFYLVALYVPNSGMDLKRLQYRVESWDPHLVKYLKQLERTKPVILTGDLNVAHLDADIYNFQAKHVPKVPGCTPQERASFGKMLSQGFVDSFRYLHPDVKGVYTYWSVRTGARKDNKGLRLDYFVTSKSLYEAGSKIKVHDSEILDSEGDTMSDHCPIMLSLDLLD